MDNHVQSTQLGATNRSPPPHASCIDQLHGASIKLPVHFDRITGDTRPGHVQGKDESSSSATKKRTHQLTQPSKQMLQVETHVGPVSTRSSLRMVLMRVDFPTFGRPTIATCTFPAAFTLCARLSVSLRTPSGKRASI